MEAAGTFERSIRLNWALDVLAARATAAWLRPCSSRARRISLPSSMTMDLARWEPMSYARSLAAMAAFCSPPLVGGLRPGCRPSPSAAPCRRRPPPAPADPRSPSAPAAGCPRRVPAAGRGRTCSGEMQDRPTRAPTAAVAHSVSTSDTSPTRTGDCASNLLNRTYRFGRLGRWVAGRVRRPPKLWPVAVRHDLRESWRMAGRSHLLNG